MLKIAINTPSLNHERYVEDFIKSVFSQGYPAITLSVVDDASTDKNYEKLKCLQAIHGFILQRNDRRMGIAATLNRAYMSNTQSDLVFAIASDDLLAPGFAAHVNDYFTANPDVDAIVGNVSYIDSQNRCIGRFQTRAEGRLDLVKCAKRQQMVMANWLVVRRNVMNTEMPYDESIQIEDLPFFIRLVKHYNVRAADFDLLCYRKHAESYSSKKTLEVYLAEKKTLERYREEDFYPYYVREAHINWFLNFSGTYKAEALNLLRTLLPDLWRLRVIKGLLRLFFYYPKR